MNRNLLIIGAGIYGIVAKEIAESMNCFEKIDFVDDNEKSTPDGISVIGTTNDLGEFACRYSDAIVAIGDSNVRLSLIKKLEEETLLNVATLISPRAYVSPTAQIMNGSVIEPMAVIHTDAVISVGCIISAGAVVNHASMCCDGVHVDCNATVAGNTVVPAGMKVKSGEVYEGKKQPHPLLPIDGKTYSFDDVM